MWQSTVDQPTRPRPEAQAALLGSTPSLDGQNLTSEAAAAWQKLLAGNARFTADRLQHPDQSSHRRAELAQDQHPLAVVLACSDSRVPPEIIFDAGLGDLFVIRVAGNTADKAALGSMEYAVEQLHTPLIVVLGHERCGAVEAAVDAEQSHHPAEGHLKAVINPILPAVKAVERQGGDLVDHAVQENVSRVVEQLAVCKPVLAEHLHERKLSIIGCRYDLDSGRVTVVNRTGHVGEPAHAAYGN